MSEVKLQPDEVFRPVAITELDYYSIIIATEKPVVLEWYHSHTQGLFQLVVLII